MSWPGSGLLCLVLVLGAGSGGAQAGAPRPSRSVTVAASVTASAGPAAVTLRKTSQQLAHSDAAWGTAAADQLQQPNIVVVLTDDQTPESVAKMPYVSSRTDWIDVPATHCENCLCCPVRAQVLQGRYDTHTQVQNNNQGRLFDESETLPVWLQRAGYRTGLFGKYLNTYPYGKPLYVPPGWDTWQVAYGGPCTTSTTGSSPTARLRSPTAASRPTTRWTC